MRMTRDSIKNGLTHSCRGLYGKRIVDDCNIKLHFPLQNLLKVRIVRQIFNERSAFLLGHVAFQIPLS
jgi:hypothetical protein